MVNSLKNEQKFFLFLQKHYSKEDVIKLDYAFIPNGVPNKLNRFYSNNTSIWFSRLKVNDNKIIYYFGSMEDEKLGIKSKILPRLILYFNKEITESSIRFYKNNFLVLIKTPKSGEPYNELKNKSLKIMHGSKNKNLNKYYVSLGELNSTNLIRNLDFFVKTFNFEMDLKSVIISIPSVLKYPTHEDNQIFNPNDFSNSYFERFRFNLKAIEIKNNISNSNLSFSGEKKLVSSIFKENIDGDYYFNETFKNKFYKSDSELLIELNNCVINLKNESNYEIIFEKIVNAITEGSEMTYRISVSASSSDNKPSENDLPTWDVDVPGEDADEIISNDEEFKFSSDLSSDSINEILQKIDLNSSPYSLGSNVKDEMFKTKLIEDLNSYTSSMMFKFKTKSLIDNEHESIVNKISEDINHDIIFGPIESLVKYYITQYKDAKRKFLACNFLKVHIKTKSFNNLISEYNYSDSIVTNIINRVKLDIEKNNLECSDIKTKFEIYFRSFKNNQKYYEELDYYRKDIDIYAEIYNLTIEELNSIFDEIGDKIYDNNGSMDIPSIIDQNIENLIFDIKSDTIKYVNELFSGGRGYLNLTETGCEKVKQETFELIYKDNLRIFEITEEYLMKLRNGMLNYGKISRNDVLVN